MTVKHRDDACEPQSSGLQSPTDCTPEGWPANYLEINRIAYDALADEYCARRESDRDKDLRLIQPFLRLLRESFPDDRISVLDIGCGNGLNLSMFANEGFTVTGIDISPRMLRVARESCPQAHLINDDFLAHPFSHSCFHGVFAKAIIHLFPKPHAFQFLAKASDILRSGGVLYTTTTVESVLVEGLRAKTDYNVSVTRYRRSWTEQELLEAVAATGLRIAETGYNRESLREKHWFNIWAVK